MINIFIQKNEVKVINTEALVSGTSNVVCVRFSLSEHWKKLRKTAVFSNGHTTINVLDSQWQAGNTCNVPWEVLALPGCIVRVGLRGVHKETTTLTTPMVSVGKVLQGADTSGDPTTDPSLPAWEQLRMEVSDRSHDCSTTIEKFKSPLTKTTVLRIHFVNPTNIPPDSGLHLYRCIRNRGARYHWQHPTTYEAIPEAGNQHWGYGLLVGRSYAYGDEVFYPSVPLWMPNDGFMQTEIPILAEDLSRGYIDIEVATYFLPLLKPVEEAMDWSECGLIGIQSDGSSNCLLMRFRICKDGTPIDLPGDTFRLGFQKASNTPFSMQNRTSLDTKRLYVRVN